MSFLLQKLVKLAVVTFPKCQTSSNSNKKEFIDLLNSLTVKDINLERNLLLDTGPFNPVKDAAPVTYMSIYEDVNLTVCVFILKRGSRLPLHDHPRMFGFLKVLHGTVSIQSYTLLNQTHGDAMVARKHPLVQVSSHDSVCQLSPDSNNLHEIHSLDGPAAFLDVLSPPYGDDKIGDPDRNCHYFLEMLSPPTLGQEKALLTTVEAPSDFWCDHALYNGPPISVD